MERNRRECGAAGVAIMARGREALALAALVPGRVLILAPSWRDLDEIRVLVATAGVSDRVRVHHRSAAPAAAAAGYRIIAKGDAA
jgi:hypothetical protein